MGGVNEHFEVVASALGVPPSAVRFERREWDNMMGVAVDFGDVRHAVLVPFGRMGDAVNQIKEWRKEWLEGQHRA